MAKIKRVQDTRDATLDAGDTIEIRVNGNIAYSRTINTGYEGKAHFSIDEYEIVA